MEIDYTRLHNLGKPPAVQEREKKQQTLSRAAHRLETVQNEQDLFIQCWYMLRCFFNIGMNDSEKWNELIDMGNAICYGWEGTPKQGLSVELALETIHYIENVSKLRDKANKHTGKEQDNDGRKD